MTEYSYDGIDLSIIGQRIRRAREMKNLTQQQLGEKLGKTPDAISNYENGQRALRITELPALAKALDISIELLFLNETTQEDRFIEAFRRIQTLPEDWLVFVLSLIEQTTQLFHNFQNGDIPTDTEKMGPTVFSNDALVCVLSFEIYPMPNAFVPPLEDSTDDLVAQQIDERLRALEITVEHEFTVFQHWIKQARTKLTR